MSQSSPIPVEILLPEIVIWAIVLTVNTEPAFNASAAVSTLDAHYVSAKMEFSMTYAARPIS